MEEIKKTLADHEKRIAELEALLKAKPQTSPEGNPDSGLNLFSKKAGISGERLKELYDFENDKLTFLHSTGIGDREKTQNITLLVLAGYKYMFNNEEILSSELRRNVAENSVALNNFGTYLNELAPSLIRRKGKPGSKKTTYKLTTLGEAKAKEKLRELGVQ